MERSEKAQLHTDIRRNDFSKGSVVRHILRIGLPMIVAELVHVFYNVVDRMYIGHIEDVGTAALTDREFLRAAVEKYGNKIAVGVDLKDGYVAIKGWTETSSVSGMDFIAELVEIGVSAIICTDISKDGAMSGTNEELYREIGERFPKLDLTASGGISNIDIVKRLNATGIYGAILGKAVYTGDIDLAEAINITK